MVRVAALYLGERDVVVGIFKKSAYAVAVGTVDVVAIVVGAVARLVVEPGEIEISLFVVGEFSDGYIVVIAEDAHAVVGEQHIRVVDFGRGNLCGLYFIGIAAVEGI